LTTKRIVGTELRSNASRGKRRTAARNPKQMHPAINAVSPEGQQPGMSSSDSIAIRRFKNGMSPFFRVIFAGATCLQRAGLGLALRIKYCELRLASRSVQQREDRNACRRSNERFRQPVPNQEKRADGRAGTASFVGSIASNVRIDEKAPMRQGNERPSRRFRLAK